MGAENKKKDANAKCKADNCKAKWAAALANYNEVYKNAAAEAKAKIDKCLKEKCVNKQCKNFTEAKKAKTSRRGGPSEVEFEVHQLLLLWSRSEAHVQKALAHAIMVLWTCRV